MKSIAVALTLLVALPACSSGAESEMNTPLPEIQAKADKADQAQLEQTIADYKAALAARETELKELATKKAEAAKKALGNALEKSGEAAKSAGDDIAEQLDALQAEVKSLTERMEVYAKELKERLAAG